jgi:hypothetical protein
MHGAKGAENSKFMEWEGKGATMIAEKELACQSMKKVALFL